MSDYDDDYDYSAHDYDDDYDESPLIPKWRMNLVMAEYWLKHRLDCLIGWLKWHSHKCKYCGKPAIANGEVCMSHCIPF